jgi:hypothetical protein
MATDRAMEGDAVEGDGDRPFLHVASCSASVICVRNRPNAPLSQPHRAATQQIGLQPHPPPSVDAKRIVAVGAVHPLPIRQESAAPYRQHGSARHRIGKIIMRTRRMID